MSLYLRLELSSPREIKEFESVKEHLGLKSNTEVLRVLIKKAVVEVTKEAPSLVSEEVAA